MAERRGCGWGRSACAGISRHVCKSQGNIQTRSLHEQTPKARRLPASFSSNPGEGLNSHFHHLSFFVSPLACVFSFTSTPAFSLQQHGTQAQAINRRIRITHVRCERRLSQLKRAIDPILLPTIKASRATIQQTNMVIPNILRRHDIPSRLAYAKAT